MPMPGISVAGLAGAAAGKKELVVGGANSATNTNSFSLFCNLNTTAGAGDVIVAAVKTRDINYTDPSSTIAMTGWTINWTSNALGGVSDLSAIAYKVASGGETSVTVSGTLTFASGTWDYVAVQVFVIKNPESTTPVETVTAGSGFSLVNNITVDTSASDFVIGSTIDINTATSAGNPTEIVAPNAGSFFYDIAPDGGATDVYSTVEIAAVSTWK